MHLPGADKTAERSKDLHAEVLESAEGEGRGFLGSPHPHTLPGSPSAALRGVGKWRKKGFPGVTPTPPHTPRIPAKGTQ